MERSRHKAILLLQELRAPFFTGSVMPVLAGTCAAWEQSGAFDAGLFAAALAGTVLLHAAANVFNDYFDHLSGNDAANRDFVRPFTGGSRLIQAGLLTPREVFGLAVICAGLGGLCGVFLWVRLGWPIALLGAAGLLGGIFYSAPPLRLAGRGWGEAVIGLNFGVLPTLGAYFVQTERVTLSAVLVSLPLTFLIVAVILINEFQDRAADAAVGKRTWVVRLGTRRSVGLYALLVTGWSLPLTAGVWMHRVPVAALVLLGLLVPAVFAVRRASGCHDRPRELAAVNGLTIGLHAAAGLLLCGVLLAAAGGGV